MNRREFIVIIGGAVWPFAALGQRSGERPLIAWLGGGRKAMVAGLVGAFRQGLQDLGYAEGSNIDIIYRFADGRGERLPALAEELVQQKPAIIVAGASDGAVAVKKVTSTIPIVVPALADAVHLGLVASDARPGGNVSGIAPYVPQLPAKQMELAREVVPGASKVGLLGNMDDPKAPPQREELEEAGRTLGIKFVVPEVRSPDDVDGATQALARERVDVVIVLQTSMILSERRAISAAAAANRLPAIYGYPEHVADGGLISYGVDLRASFYRAASYVQRILNGAAPGDLPVEFPNKVQMVINLKTAKALGLTIPPSLLARADEVIE